MYLVLNRSRHRGSSWDVQSFDRNGLNKWLEETVAKGEQLTFIDSIVELGKCLGTGYLIVEVEVIIPKPITVVTKFEF